MVKFSLKLLQTELKYAMSETKRRSLLQIWEVINIQGIKLQKRLVRRKIGQLRHPLKFIMVCGPNEKWFKHL